METSAEHQVRGFGVERDVADLVDDEQRDERQPPQLGLELALAFGLAERATHWVAVANCDALAGEAGADPERDREVGFAGAGRSEQDHVLAGVEEVELAEVLDHRLLHRALEGEVELLERLAGGEAGGLDPALAAVAVAGRRPRCRAATSAKRS